MLREFKDNATALRRFRSEVATDLLMLAALHAREFDRTSILALWVDCYDTFLALPLKSSEAVEALELFRAGLTDIPSCLDSRTLQDLATEQTAIYASQTAGLAPCESSWLNAGDRPMQDGVHSIQEWFGRYRVGDLDWWAGADDHVVAELKFAFELMSPERANAPLFEVARFLDEHPLRWMDAFASAVKQRSQMRLLKGIAALTAAYLAELRRALDELEQQSLPALQPEHAGHSALDRSGPFCQQLRERSHYPTFPGI